MSEEMNRYDLKTGQQVTLRNSKQYIVIVDISGTRESPKDVLFSKDGQCCLLLTNYFQDGCHEEKNEFDIIRIDGFHKIESLFRPSCTASYNIWKRPPEKMIKVGNKEYSEETIQLALKCYIG